MDLHGKVPVRCPIDENHPSRFQCGPQPRHHDLPLVREQIFVDSAKHDETKCPIRGRSSLPEGEQRNFTLPRERNALMRFALSIFSGLSSTPTTSVRGRSRPIVMVKAPFPQPKSSNRFSAKSSGVE